MKTEILIEKISIKPGKPTVFGRIGEKFVFGLPGNPVSAFVIFELFVKPFLMECMGCLIKKAQLRLAFGTDMQFRKSDRTSFVPVKINTQGEIEIIEYHGSAHINSLIDADGLAIIDKQEDFIKKGETVYVRLF